MNSSSFYGIDLFAGAGGLSLGAELAGVKVEHAVEIDASAAETYRINHPETLVFENDVRTVEPPKRKKGGSLILFGGPPCQGFSTSNQRTRNAKNANNWLYREIFRFARKLSPDWIVIENVTGLEGTSSGIFYEMITDEFTALKYDVGVWNLCSVDFGVPQRRNRLFFIASRNSRIPAAPMAMIRNNLTVREAISDLPMLKSGANVDSLPYGVCPPSEYAKTLRSKATVCTGNLVTRNNALILKRYTHIPEGGNWYNIPKALMRNYTNLTNSRSRHSGIYRRLTWEQPSVVIANFRKNMLVHPEQNRGLSIREAARIQSFPDSFVFSGSLGFQQQQVSNAVPPMLAKAVFSQIVS